MRKDRKEYIRKFNSSPIQRRKRNLWMKSVRIVARRHEKELMRVYRQLAKKEGLEFKYLRK